MKCQQNFLSINEIGRVEGVIQKIVFGSRGYTGQVCQRCLRLRCLTSRHYSSRLNQNLSASCQEPTITSSSDPLTPFTDNTYSTCTYSHHPASHGHQLAAAGAGYTCIAVPHRNTL
ncbi:hypothetical protein E2C01_099613 [Portunus trituberculatus]|uniref:Uncharacterized protein n=1 Tax=Portunus trituberculatus TaxID=210409 RepID=A0A5B7K0R5_PORTR|nr:hypothetical protein [Portunus trituberculatus]